MHQMFWVGKSSSSSSDSCNNVIDALRSLAYLQMQFIADICFWESLPLWDALVIPNHVTELLPVKLIITTNY